MVTDHYPDTHIPTIWRRIAQSLWYSLIKLETYQKKDLTYVEHVSTIIVRTSSVSNAAVLWNTRL